MKPSRSEFITVNQRRYHVRIWGEDDAPTVFFLHGWGDTSASFQFVVDALAKHWRVIAPDWRGFGLSQWNEGAYWFLDYLADLDGLLEHYSPHQSAQIAGHSMGGIVTSLYAGIRPERVARFANLEGFVLWTALPEDSPEQCGKWLHQIREGHAGFRPYKHAAEFAERLGRDNSRLTRERADFLAEHLLCVTPEGFSFAADPHHRWVNPFLYPPDAAKVCWRRVRAPTLWVAGLDSFVMKQFAEHPDEYTERRSCFADVREVLLDDCGHNVHHDQPERIARLLDDFFA
jgi:pimeloyl-ACP methyl ester carboxylesterase